MRSCELSYSRRLVVGLSILLGFSVAPIEASEAPPPPIAEVALTPVTVFWQPQVGYETLILTVSAPGGEVHRQEFAQGEPVAFSSTDQGGAPLPDGPYTYELRVIPALDKNLKKALAASRETGDDTLARELQQSGIVPREPLTQTGYFTISGGKILQTTASESE